MARDLRLFYVFRLLATSYLWFPVFVHFMIERGLGFDQITLLAAVYSVVVILVEVPTGALADRIGRRQSMMAGALAMVASCAVAVFAHGFAAFAAVTLLAAVSMSLCSGADSAYLFDLLHNHGRGHEYPRREGTSSAWHLGGNVFAFAAGGFLGEIDLVLPYVATAATAGAAFVVALLMGEEGHLSARHGPPRPVAVELRQYVRLIARSLAHVVKTRPLLWIIAYSAVVFVLVRATDYLYQPYLKARGFGIAETGLVFAGVSAIAALVAHNVHRLRRGLGEAPLVWGLLGTLALSFLLLGQIAGPWAVCVMALQAAAIGLHSPLVKPILNRQISDSGRRATVLSVESIARRAATGVFIPVAGFYGAASAISLFGALGTVGVLLLAVFLRHAPRASEPVPARTLGASTSAPQSVD